MSVGCNQVKKDTETVQKTIIEHVAKAGLTPDKMNIEVKSLKNEGDGVVADVTFVPKSMPSAAQTWTYRLESKDGKLQVVGKSLASGSGMGGGAAPETKEGELPAGHPPVGNK